MSSSSNNNSNNNNGNESSSSHEYRHRVLPRNYQRNPRTDNRVTVQQVRRYALMHERVPNSDARRIVFDTIPSHQITRLDIRHHPAGRHNADEEYPSNYEVGGLGCRCLFKHH
jgi:hypothetical protein